MYGSRGRSKWFTLLSNARLAGKLPNVHQLSRRKVHNNISTLFKRSIFVPAKLFSRQVTPFFLFFNISCGMTKSMIDLLLSWVQHPCHLSLDQVLDAAECSSCIYIYIYISKSETSEKTLTKPTTQIDIPAVFFQTGPCNFYIKMSGVVPNDLVM